MHLSAIICPNSAAGPSSVTDEFPLLYATKCHAKHRKIRPSPTAPPKIRIFPLLLFIVVILHRFRPVASVATRLLFSDNDDSLLQAWHELVALQAKQSAIAHRDHPVDERLRISGDGGLKTLLKIIGLIKKFSVMRIARNNLLVDGQLSHKRVVGVCPSSAVIMMTHFSRLGMNLLRFRPNKVPLRTVTIPWTNGFSFLCANVVVVLLLHRPGTAHRHGTTMMILFSASTLAPQRVEIYAELGHLTQFCGAKEPFMTKRTTFDIQQLAEVINQQSVKMLHTEFRNKCSVRSPSPSSLSSSPSVSSNYFRSSLSLAQISL
ncbi:hypothetical protein niasHT_005425 [Heterodera trifolii]|uniref:Uncharacterized protein n=1 Tax=Heterodera trifolii TaxID=157864 RepID=A0ABD2MF60_9BILA